MKKRGHKMLKYPRKPLWAYRRCG